MTLSEILGDSEYKLTQFNVVEIHNFEKRIELRKDSKTMIDSAAGNYGFPVHTIFHVWEQLIC